MGILDLLELHEYRKIIKASKEIQKDSRKMRKAMDEIEEAFDEEDDLDDDAFRRRNRNGKR